MKTKIIYLLVLTVFFSCSKNKNGVNDYKEELTQTIQSKIEQELEKGSKIKTIKLVKIDTLSERQELGFVLSYSNNRLIKLKKQKEQLINELDNVKSEVDLEIINSKNRRLSDSIQKELKIEEDIRKLNFKDYKTGNYQTVFLLEIFNQESNTIEKDSLFMYVNDKKIIFTQSQFIEQCIKNFYKSNNGKNDRKLIFLNGPN